MVRGGAKSKSIRGHEPPPPLFQKKCGRGV